MQFEPFKKIPRLSREMIVTEKIDGTNAQVGIEHKDAIPGGVHVPWFGEVGDYVILAGSRNRWLAPGKGDNFGFAGWVQEHAEELVAELGSGCHFGEWWGQGIQRTYGLKEKRFWLFNVKRWGFLDSEDYRNGGPKKCFHVVPVLYRGPFCTAEVQRWIDYLAEKGSVAAPGFMDPEGLVVFHVAASALFKRTIKDDDKAKSEVENV